MSLEVRLEELEHRLTRIEDRLDFLEELRLLKSLRKRYTAEQLEIRVDANGAFSTDTFDMDMLLSLKAPLAMLEKVMENLLKISSKAPRMSLRRRRSPTTARNRPATAPRKRQRCGPPGPPARRH